jgi:hypothetical protein
MGLLSCSLTKIDDLGEIYKGKDASNEKNVSAFLTII